MVSYTDGIGGMVAVGKLPAPLDFSQGVPSQAPRGFRYSIAIQALENMNENRRSENESLICLKIAAVPAKVKNPCCAVTFFIEINPIHGAVASMTLLYPPICLNVHCVPS